ncbi:MAG: hypothetical protein ACW991_00675 [Candidatus Hodarchaeales archaeon]|jgi:hypothetical protein
MPFAGFATFDACTKAQMNRHKGEKGFTMENARRICGFLQARAEKAKKLSDKNDVFVIEHNKMSFKV